MLSFVFLFSLACFFFAYLLYGPFLRRRFGLDDSRPTPAVALEDGVDYCPARTPVLFGHHFSSIAGAGPIVGPVLAGVAFGWLPALIWVVLGAIFIGGVHDMGSLAASIRHGARSVAEIARENITPRAGRLFLLFIWFALLLVLAAFIDLTASTFVADGGVASSSAFYILLALLFGLCLYRLKISLRLGTVIFVPLVFVVIWAGQQVPADAVVAAADAKQIYVFVLIAYCFVASITPVWLLLQPRDYLSSFLLYACLAGGAAGIVLSGADVRYPAFRSFSSDSFGFLFPALFITVACGACSGFHSIVASGTTAKQLATERAAQAIGYGGMLTEGALAVIALAAVMVCAVGSGALDGPPTEVFARGLGGFFAALGIPVEAGVSFGLLAISTFLLTTLDTATRLARYVFEELIGAKGWWVKIVATVFTLGFPLLITSIPVTMDGKAVPAYKMIWPIFGSTNQLLAGLALLTLSVWLKRTGRKALFAVIPMIFMLAVTLWAIVAIIVGCLSKKEGIGEAGNLVRFSASSLLLVLALFVIAEAFRSLRGRKGSP
jgi:carbon starvation protein